MVFGWRILTLDQRVLGHLSGLCRGIMVEVGTRIKKIQFLTRWRAEQSKYTHTIKVQKEVWQLSNQLANPFKSDFVYEIYRFKLTFEPDRGFRQCAYLFHEAWNLLITFPRLISTCKLSLPSKTPAQEPKSNAPYSLVWTLTLWLYLVKPFAAVSVKG